MKDSVITLPQMTQCLLGEYLNVRLRILSAKHYLHIELNDHLKIRYTEGTCQSCLLAAHLRASPSAVAPAPSPAQL